MFLRPFLPAASFSQFLLTYLLGFTFLTSITGKPAPLAFPRQTQDFAWGQSPVRGVNLGGWLVLEAGLFRLRIEPALRSSRG